MRAMEREVDVEGGPGSRGHGCCGGSGCCGGHGHGPRFEAEDEATARRSALEARQRDLEQELADVTGRLRDLGAGRS